MEKKKKIIVALVSLVFAGLLVGFIKIIMFPSDTPESIKADVSIITPKVDEEQVNRKSKLENYQRDESDSLNYGIHKVINNLTDAPSIEMKKDPMSEMILRSEEEERLEKLANGQSTQSIEENEDAAVENELKMIMEMQEKMMDQSYPQEEPSDQDLQTLMQSYNQHMASPNQQQMMGGPNLVGITPGKITKTAQNASEGLANSVKSKTAQKNYFQGAGSANSSDNVLDLVPAETVDQGVLVNGSTIAIRTKKQVRLKSPALLIPKGAIVYGKVTLSANRLLVDVTSYKKENKLYILDFSLYDYDGSEGVHLDSRTWPKIPSKVAKDIYNYAYQKGTQASTFGGGENNIDLDEVKDLSILSAANEVSKEVFDKRKLFMPKKYHLWFNINSN